MNEEHEKYFTTYDIFLASTLESMGFKIVALDKKNPKKVEFCFQHAKGLDEAAHAYWLHELRLDPQIVTSNLKSLKNRLYSD